MANIGRREAVLAGAWEVVHLEQIQERLLEELQNPILFTIPVLGGIPVSQSVVVSWIVMAVLIAASLLLTCRLKVRSPGRIQAGLEMAVEFLNQFAVSNMGERGSRFAPYLGTVGLYIFLCNVIGVFGLAPPTKDINVTAALAVMSALLIYGAQFRYRGLAGGLKSLPSRCPFCCPSI